MDLTSDEKTRPHPRNVTSDRTLQTWESWVDEAIRDARERGDFNDLPGAGRPLQIERNPFAGDREVGFHVLKNADLLPRWMELDRELARSLAALDRFGDQGIERLARMRTRASRHVGTAEAPRRCQRFVDWLLLGSASLRSSHQPRLGQSDVERERQRTRRQYLERAAAVDKLIQEYNQALPDEIRWLERARLLPEQAAAGFDAAWSRLDPEVGASGT